MKKLLQSLLSLREQMLTVNGVTGVSINAEHGIIKVGIEANRRLLHEQLSEILPTLDIDSHMCDYDMKASSHTIILRTK